VNSTVKIALIRGPSLNPWEFQAFTPLPARFRVTAFANTYTPYWHDHPLPIPIIRCWSADSLAAPFGRQAVRYFNGMSSRLLGFSHYMVSLEEKLQGFHILHSNEVYNTFSYQAARAKVRYGNKLVETVWETLPHRGEAHPLRKHRKRIVMERTDRFFAMSEAARQMLITEGVAADRIRVVMPGIDCNHFAPRAPDPALRRLWSADQDSFVVLCVARLVAEKGIDDLLEAGQLLLRSKGGKCVRIVLVGSGPERNRLSSKAENLGIAGAVVFFPTILYERMPFAYASADCLVLPSRATEMWEEQYGYALVEAMSAGRPVVSTRTGAIPEVVGDAGLLVPDRRPDLIAIALMQLIEDSKLREQLSQKGRERAVAQFSGSVAAQRLAAAYSELAG
jgi:alpha-maltose-1-phosphate synthase